MNVSQAYTIARFFSAIEKQVARAFGEGRDEDALTMCRMKGTLQVRIFGISPRSPFDDPKWEVAA